MIKDRKHQLPLVFNRRDWVTAEWVRRLTGWSKYEVNRLIDEGVLITYRHRDRGKRWILKESVITHMESLRQSASI